MGFTTDQYTQLVGAIAQGALMVQYADKKVEYRSMDEMMRLKRAMEADLGIESGTRSVRKYADFSTGLNNGCQ